MYSVGKSKSHQNKKQWDINKIYHLILSCDNIGHNRSSLSLKM